MKKGKNRIITLTTDFGTQDGYPAVMRGVMLAINHRVTCIDLTHDIPPQDVARAAFVIGTSFHWFPVGSVHVVVVDPGVGTSRRALAVKAAGHTFVGPDNGVFTLIFKQQPLAIYEITNRKYQLPNIGQTFHGRDVFAPAAAWLAKEINIERVGRPIHDPVRLAWEEPQVAGRTITARIVHIDRFGNLVTNLTSAFMREHLEKFTLSLGGQTITGLAASYAGAGPGKLLAIIGSSGFLEIAVDQGNAATLCRLGVNDTLDFTVQ
jgi:S-adenosylmethionine hydrolase